jgi:hypothetical protein
MAELRRVLKPAGWAVLLVPILSERTVEDATVTDVEERRRRYGHPDHVRIYGHDFADRLREAGFTVRRLRPTDLLSPEDARRIGVDSPDAGDIFHCS